MTNISKVHNNIIAVSYLKESQREDTFKEWDCRFLDNECYWVDASGNDSTENIGKKIIEELKKQNIKSVAGKSFIIALFLDMTEPVDKEKAEEIIKVSDWVSNTLNCTIPFTFEFCYLGCMAYGNKSLFKDNVKAVIAANMKNIDKRIQLCLVSEAPLQDADNSHSWKAVMLFLDVLCRSTTPSDLIPIQRKTSNDDIGFLRYAEYDPVTVDKLNKEIETLDRKLSDKGYNEIQQLLKEKCEILSKEISGKYHPEEGMIPIHPYMYTDNITLLNKKKVLDDYEKGRAETVKALEKTAGTISERIKLEYFKSETEYDKLLKECFDGAQVGILLEQDERQMLSLFEETALGNEPFRPDLSYDKKRKSPDMTPAAKYLKDVVQYACTRQCNILKKGLETSYLKRDSDYYAEKEAELQKKKNRVVSELQAILTKQAFVNMIISKDRLHESCFNPIISGGSTMRAVVCRNINDANELDQRNSGNLPDNYLIQQGVGGHNNPAPMEAVEFLLFDCTDERLDDIIK